MPLNARQLFAAPTRFPGLGSFSAKPAIFGRARGRRRPPLSGHADRPAHSGPQRNLRALERVQHYSRSILAIRNGHEIVGCFAALLLNHDGFERLLDGDLNVSDPSQSHLVRPGETAAAIYVWALCMTGMAAGATGNVMEWLRHEICARRNSTRGQAPQRQGVLDPARVPPARGLRAKFTLGVSPHASGQRHMRSQ